VPGAELPRADRIPDAHVLSCFSHAELHKLRAVFSSHAKPRAQFAGMAWSFEEQFRMRVQND